MRSYTGATEDAASGRAARPGDTAASSPSPPYSYCSASQDVEPRGAPRREDRGNDPDEDRGDREDDQLADGKREVDEVHARHEQGPEHDAEGDPEHAADQRP